MHIKYHVKAWLNLMYELEWRIMHLRVYFCLRGGDDDEGRSGGLFPELRMNEGNKQQNDT